MASNTDPSSGQVKARQSSNEDASHLENGDKEHQEKMAAQREEDVHVQWTFTRVVAIISLCLVYVGMIHARVSFKGWPQLT